MYRDATYEALPWSSACMIRGSVGLVPAGKAPVRSCRSSQYSRGIPFDPNWPLPSCVTMPSSDPPMLHRCSMVVGPYTGLKNISSSWKCFA